MLILIACAERAPLVEDTGEVTVVTPPEPEPPTTVDFGTFAPRNLVVVHVDTLRADALERWGSPYATTPNMNARGGWVSVSDVISTASWTIPATASLMTGNDLPFHDLRTYDPEHLSTLRGVTAAESLREAGFQTAMITGAGLLMDPELSIGKGFGSAGFVPDQPDNAGGMLDGVEAFLDDLDDVPFFLFLQPTDPHAPYQPADGDLGTFSDVTHIPFDPTAPAAAQEQAITHALNTAPDDATREAILTQVQAVYDEQALGLDRAIEQIFVALEERGHLDDTLVIVAADHGESFFEGWPEFFGHGVYVRREMVHVPLLFWGAGLTGEHVTCLASNMDILPTALDLLGVAPIADAEGRSLRTEGCRDVAYSSTYEVGTDGELLTWVSATSLEAQVVVDCAHAQSVAFDLRSDPRATLDLPIADVVGASELVSALGAYRDGVTSTLPGVSCPGF